MGIIKSEAPWHNVPSIQTIPATGLEEIAESKRVLIYILRQTPTVIDRGKSMIFSKTSYLYHAKILTLS